MYLITVELQALELQELGVLGNMALPDKFIKKAAVSTCLFEILLKCVCFFI